MQNTVEFLDAVKAKHGFTSDYQLSKHLDCTRSAISSYRMGKSFLDDEIACKVARDLKLNSSYVLNCIASERARKPEVKAAFAHAAELLYGMAAVLVLTVSLVLVDADIMPAPLKSLEVPAVLASVGFNISSDLYIMRISPVVWLGLAILLYLAFPRHNPRPEKEPKQAE